MERPFEVLIALDATWSGLVSRKGCGSSPSNLCVYAETLGLLRSPFATQGRSYKGSCMFL